MSIGPITLDELNRPRLTVEQEREREWLEAHAMSPTRTDCRNCGAHVSREFVRTHGFDSHVEHCPSCVSLTALRDGAAMDPEFQARCDSHEANQAYRGDGR